MAICGGRRLLWCTRIAWGLVPSWGVRLSRGFGGFGEAGAGLVGDRAAGVSRRAGRVELWMPRDRERADGLGRLGPGALHDEPGVAYAACFGSHGQA